MEKHSVHPVQCLNFRSIQIWQSWSPEVELTFRRLWLQRNWQDQKQQRRIRYCDWKWDAWHWEEFRGQTAPRSAWHKISDLAYYLVKSSGALHWTNKRRIHLDVARLRGLRICKEERWHHGPVTTALLSGRRFASVFCPVRIEMVDSSIVSTKTTNGNSTILHLVAWKLLIASKW